MRVALKLHPDSVCDAVTSIEVDAWRPQQPGKMVLIYRIKGTMDDVRVPPHGHWERTDGLWKSSCYEAFLRTKRDGGYYEFNFSPSTRWASYRFDGYRSGQRAADVTPKIDETTWSHEELGLRAFLDLAQAPDLPAGDDWLLNLSAVIEETNGRLSYWAVRHPPGKPDFHHADCFALELPPPSRA